MISAPSLKEEAQCIAEIVTILVPIRLFRPVFKSPKTYFEAIDSLSFFRPLTRSASFEGFAGKSKSGQVGGPAGLGRLPLVKGEPIFSVLEIRASQSLNHQISRDETQIRA
ncbi:hypothetical protein D2Q93_15680 [Alicyclobacillaceae bacterium I2511]|nr:hypothetical protein D2Q93_15680 [Alicyclobacillaceae bacterium I2511]